MKKIILISFLFFIYGCGYTSIYKNLKDYDFQLIITDMQGDKDVNNLIRNQINLYSNKNSINRFEIKIDTKYKKQVLTKNITGLVTDYILSVDTTLTINFEQLSKEVTFYETITIKNKNDTFEQNLYEKNIKDNFASSIREKLISEILTLE